MQANQRQKGIEKVVETVGKNGLSPDLVVQIPAWS